MRGLLQQALSGRTPRERALLALLAVLAAGWAFWALGLQPLRGQAAALEARLHRHELAIPRVSALPPPVARTPEPTDDRPLPVIVAETAAAVGLDLRRLQDRDGTASVQIDAAGFDALMLWIEALEGRHGLRLTEVSLTAAEQPGIVAATLQVTR